jgi:glycosyltransferase involved in cell wall biosynthesis
VRRLGIVANEFFDPDLAHLNGQFEPALGRSGGFGWAAAHAASALDGRMEVVFISTEHRAMDGRREVSSNGRRLLLVPPDPGHWRALLRRERLHALLTIDYRVSYKPVLQALPRTPLVVWARDPRSPEDIERIETLRVPGDAAPPQGIGFNDCSSLPQAARPNRRRRHFVLASPSPRFLAPKSGPAYGIPVERLALLPNPLPVPELRPRSEQPVVVFLGRLDPIKRPWLAVELARRLPEVRFLFLGEAHFEGPGSWAPAGLPPNIELLGRRGGAEKLDILGSAWALLNTSIHEGFPVSFMEALALGTPVVAAVDPEGAVSRFGACVEQSDGDGLASVPAFESALRDLLADSARRERLGREARDWLLSVHTPERFADRLEVLLSGSR